jgi:putative transposase
MSLRLSILDLAPIGPGQTARESFAASVELARAAERLGYRRVWYAEHHNMASIASSATSVLIGHVADHTTSIRLGAGGVMLPNHSPLTIAEQFGTLETLHPGRIDLGLGRAPGADGARCARCAGRHRGRRLPAGRAGAAGLPAGPVARSRAWRPCRGGTNVPLVHPRFVGLRRPAGGRLGLPYGFASHFAPAELHAAVARYRAEFRPSEQLAEPYVIVGANVVAADDTADAQEQFATVRRRFVRSMIGRRDGAPDYADEQIDAFLTSPNGRPIADMLRYTAVGTVAEVGRYLEQFAASVHADEVIVAHHGVGRRRPAALGGAHRGSGGPRHAGLAHRPARPTGRGEERLRGRGDAVRVVGHADVQVGSGRGDRPVRPRRRG